MWTTLALTRHTTCGFHHQLSRHGRSSRFLLRRLASNVVDDKSTGGGSDRDIPVYDTPWDKPSRQDYKQKRSNKSRFRQHVNPLARRFQMQTPLSDKWPKDVFEDMSLPLHLDIGCGKGGFLLELAQRRPGKNYLGLEIRPSVAEFAKQRIAKRNLTGFVDFVGCNANVDLDRMLSRYVEAGGGPIDTVSIQFPDPHFKTQHAKRRVVTPSLILTLAKFMPESSTVFLQSDVQDVLDDMRLRFRDFESYFEDDVKDVNDYLSYNVIGIPTEREISVIERDLPVYRTTFRRSETLFEEKGQ